MGFWSVFSRNVQWCSGCSQRLFGLRHRPLVYDQQPKTLSIGQGIARGGGGNFVPVSHCSGQGKSSVD